MALNDLLNEDWSEYDKGKSKDGCNGQYFDCSKSWERDFLIRKIRNKYPDIPVERIETAIAHCCKPINTTYQRKTFVECVLKKLGVV